ncbi:hypothetical protein [Bacillus sp. 2205SS5-2]|uniref:hypothetical protein n=1 Tax=Bacillus sp. 2205SS5-2 TaxID=3109031 RepID=UPI00300438AF
MSAEEKYHVIAEHFVLTENAVKGSMFGAKCLKRNRKVFAMFHNNEMVFKLPVEKQEQLLSSEEGSPFEPMPGRVMNGWISVSDQRKWEALAAEALVFVAV